MLWLPTRRLLAGVGYPTFIGSQEATNTGTSLTISASGAQVGDLIIALLNADSADAWNTASGFTESVDQAAVPGLGLQYREHDGSANYTFTKAGGSTSLSGQLLAFRNAAFDVAGTVGTRETGNSAAFDAPGITCAGGIACCWLITDNGAADESNFTGPSGFTDVNYTGSAGSDGKSYRKQVGAGATGNLSVRIAVSTGTKAAVLFSVKRAV